MEFDKDKLAHALWKARGSKVSDLGHCDVMADKIIENYNKPEDQDVLGLEDFMELDKKRFGPEDTLQQVLWDGQVDDTYFNETFTAIVMLMRRCVEDEEARKQLYEIDLENYKDDQDDQ